VAETDIAKIEFVETPLGLGDQARVSLDGADLGGELRRDRRGIAGARADLQHPIAGADFRRLDHAGDNVGLRDRLALANRQRSVLVGKFLEPRLDEGFARCALHRVEDTTVADAAPSDLDITIRSRA
jgi:hypothetical protein